MTGFDGACCRLLQVDYEELAEETLKGGADDQVLEWAVTRGRKPSDEEIEIWNDYLSKQCWRDRFAPRLEVRLREAGMPTGSALTMFDFIDLDEGRSPVRRALSFPKKRDRRRGIQTSACACNSSRFTNSRADECVACRSTGGATPASNASFQRVTQRHQQVARFQARKIVGIWGDKVISARKGEIEKLLRHPRANRV